MKRILTLNTNEANETLTVNKLNKKQTSEKFIYITLVVKLT